jgi:hypothetical protein
MRAMFYFPILCHTQSGNQPQEDLAKFGYKADREVEKLGILLYFCDLLELLNLNLAVF